jgi:hypothetical protein
MHSKRAPVGIPRGQFRAETPAPSFPPGLYHLEIPSACKCTRKLALAS